MDANIALASLPSSGTRSIGAECRSGVHACPPSSVGERTKRSMAGPPFALQGHLTTVQGTVGECRTVQDFRLVQRFHKLLEISETFLRRSIDWRH
jgi:hypothetical protein